MLHKQSKQLTRKKADKKPELVKNEQKMLKIAIVAKSNNVQGKIGNTTPKLLIK